MLLEKPRLISIITMEMCSRKLLFHSLFLILFFTQTRSQNFTFDFPSFNHTSNNLTLLGDSYINKDGAIGLTRRARAPSSSSGSVIYANPIPFFDKNHSNVSVSFSTRFTFFIDSVNPWSSGGGLCFFLSPNNQTLGSPGGFLGLVNSSQLTKNRFVAVEFDTEQDLHFDDPDENHVGLDLDSLVSVKTASAMVGGVNLKSGFSITAWIDYENNKKLEVFLSYSSLKPGNPVMVVDIDLSDYLNDFIFVGFSGSTERSTELHYIQNWSFQSSVIRVLSPRINSQNVGDDSVPVSHFSIKWLALILGICGVAFVFAVFCWICLKKTENFFDENQEFPREFSYKELRSATRNFNSKNVIGQGGFGTVYKAIFLNSCTIGAVKKLKTPRKGKSEFIAELSSIAKLNHKNLLRLQGWCDEKGELLVVYDYMANGSLDKILFQDENPLKWPYRYNIAVGLASVLTYLHQEQVIHRGLKASNVMLDSRYNPRLGDLGLYRLMGPSERIGHMAPEYLLYGDVSEKSDVYSFGVVILEMCCGKKMTNLVDWVWRFHYEGRVIEAADKRLNGEFKEDEMRKLLVLGLKCTHPDSSERPSMERVLEILMNEGETMVIPRIKPAFTFSNKLVLGTDEILSEDEKSGFLNASLRSDSIQEQV